MAQIWRLSSKRIQKETPLTVVFSVTNSKNLSISKQMMESAIGLDAKCAIYINGIRNYEKKFRLYSKGKSLYIGDLEKLSGFKGKNGTIVVTITDTDTQDA
eukprot:826802_1